MISFHILQISKMRPRGVKEIIQCQTTIKHWSQNSKPDSLLPKSMGFTTILYILKLKTKTSQCTSVNSERHCGEELKCFRETPLMFNICQLLHGLLLWGFFQHYMVLLSFQYHIFVEAGFLAVVLVRSKYGMTVSIEQKITQSTFIPRFEKSCFT